MNTENPSVDLPSDLVSRAEARATTEGTTVDAIVDAALSGYVAPTCPGCHHTAGEPQRRGLLARIAKQPAQPGPCDVVTVDGSGMASDLLCGCRDEFHPMQRD